MKILFFIDSLPAGGKERRLVELMKVLDQQTQIEFELAVMSRFIHYEEIIELQVPIHYLIRRTKRDIKVVADLFKICRSIKPDIIHCWDGMTAIYSVPVCRHLNIALVNGMVTNAPQNQNIKNTNWVRAKLTFPFSSRIISNSYAGIASYSAPKNKSSVIYNGFNFSRIREIIPSDVIREQLHIENNLVVGMVATFSKVKDYQTYFLAAQKLLEVRKDVVFIAIGTDTDSDDAKKMIKAENLKYFRLLGKIKHVESIVNVMDVCVLATFTEGISNAILEYMAMGKPVIATNGGGTNEIVVNNKTGFLIDVSAPNQLSEKMQLLLNDENLRVTFGKAGKARIEDVFSIEAMLNGYLSVYNKIYQKA